MAVHDTHEELESWKIIGGALGVSERTAKRLGRGETGLKPIPTYLSLRHQRAILRVDLETWRQEVRLRPAQAAQNDVEAVVVRGAA